MAFHLAASQFPLSVRLGDSASEESGCVVGINSYVPVWPKLRPIYGALTCPTSGRFRRLHLYSYPTPADPARISNPPYVPAIASAIAPSTPVSLPSIGGPISGISTYAL